MEHNLRIASSLSSSPERYFTNVWSSFFVFLFFNNFVAVFSEHSNICNLSDCKRRCLRGQYKFKVIMAPPRRQSFFSELFFVSSGFTFGAPLPKRGSWIFWNEDLTNAKRRGHSEHFEKVHGEGWGL